MATVLVQRSEAISFQKEKKEHPLLDLFEKIVKFFTNRRKPIFNDEIGFIEHFGKSLEPYFVIEEERTIEQYELSIKKNLRYSSPDYVLNLSVYSSRVLIHIKIECFEYTQYQISDYVFQNYRFGRSDDIGHDCKLIFNLNEDKYEAIQASLMIQNNIDIYGEAISNEQHCRLLLENIVDRGEIILVIDNLSKTDDATLNVSYFPMIRSSNFELYKNRSDGALISTRKTRIDIKNSSDGSSFLEFSGCFRLYVYSNKLSADMIERLIAVNTEEFCENISEKYKNEELDLGILFGRANSFQFISLSTSDMNEQCSSYVRKQIFIDKQKIFDSYALSCKNNQMLTDKFPLSVNKFRKSSVQEWKIFVNEVLKFQTKEMAIIFPLCIFERDDFLKQFIFNGEFFMGNGDIYHKFYELEKKDCGLYSITQYVYEENRLISEYKEFFSSIKHLNHKNEEKDSRIFKQISYDQNGKIKWLYEQIFEYYLIVRIYCKYLNYHIFYESDISKINSVFIKIMRESDNSLIYSAEIDDKVMDVLVFLLDTEDIENLRDLMEPVPMCKNKFIQSKIKSNKPKPKSRYEIELPNKEILNLGNDISFEFYHNFKNSNQEHLIIKCGNTGSSANTTAIKHEKKLIRTKKY